jgi:tetratricopeptide repeat protein 8
MTAKGRMARLGTASLVQQGDLFIDVEKVNMRSIAEKNAIAKQMFEYVFYVEHNYRKALELAAEAVKVTKSEDWWWKEKLGKCYYQIGMYRDSEKHLISSIQSQASVNAYYLLSHIYIKLDQPMNTITILKKAIDLFSKEPVFHLALGRVYEMLNDEQQSFNHYKLALNLENNNIEAVACIANHYFYEDSPEISLRFYKRLMDLGVNNTEIWNNIAVCLFTNSQFDLFYPCVQKALTMTEDPILLTDLWYNIAQMAMMMGEKEAAYRAIKISLSYDGSNAEALNNLGIFELKKGKVESALYNFKLAMKENQYLFEPHFNYAINCYKIGKYEEAFEVIKKAIEIYPDHPDSRKLFDLLKGILK